MRGGWLGADTVTGADGGFVIRPPLVARWRFVGLIVLVELWLPVGGPGLKAWLPWDIWPLLWLVPAVLYARMQVLVAGDALTYRGMRRSRSWRRDQIASFGVALIPSPFARRPYVYLTAVDGEQVTFRMNPWGLAKPESWLATLDAWLSGDRFHGS